MLCLICKNESFQGSLKKRNKNVALTKCSVENLILTLECLTAFDKRFKGEGMKHSWILQKMGPNYQKEESTSKSLVQYKLNVKNTLNVVIVFILLPFLYFKPLDSLEERSCSTWLKNKTRVYE